MIRLLILLIALMLPTQMAHAFCGFYVAKADTSLFNEASKVVLSRHEDRTVITMANDFKGEVSDFAIVVPVPTVIEEGQVNVTENRIIDHLDAYTAPRLVEYFDDNPCNKFMYKSMAFRAAPQMAMMEDAAEVRGARAKSLGVTIESEFTKGEYDISVLSAKQSDGLLTFLNEEGYKLPEGAEKILKSYIKQEMKFFVAKVNLEEFDQSGYTYLRPLQVAYESSKFMLPIRLGTLNADKPQEIVLFTLTKKGRVEPTNYRTVKLPTGMDLPLFVRDKDEFSAFYKQMFAEQVEEEDMKAVFLEYAWDMAWCDPCAADPLPHEDLRTLGVWWLKGNQKSPHFAPLPNQTSRPIQPRILPGPAPVDVFVTRLHARYTADTFPEDIILQETEDRENFQGRYVLRHPYTEVVECEEAKGYYESLPRRFESEAKTLANLTGWDIDEIRSKMEEGGQSFKIKPRTDERKWWEKIWEKETAN